MKKIVKIKDKEYTMNASSFTQFKYKDATGRNLMNDLKTLTKIGEIMKKSEDGLDIIGELDDFNEIILRLSYIMIDEADSNQVQDFETFAKNIDGMFDDTDWLYQVIELATSPISRGNKANPQ